MKKLLVVVDMQNDFVSGALGTEGARSVVSAAEALIVREKRAGAEIVFTQDTHGGDYLKTSEGRLLPVPHCMKGTEGWEIVPRLKLLAAGEKRFEKSTFASISLAEYARDGEYAEIALCGVCTDICVVSNAILLKAYCPEATVRVISAACAGTTPENHNAALLTMRSCQIFVE